MPDLFFYRDPEAEEVKAEEEKAAGVEEVGAAAVEAGTLSGQVRLPKIIVILNILTYIRVTGKLLVVALLSLVLNPPSGLPELTVLKTGLHHLPQLLRVPLESGALLRPLNNGKCRFYGGHVGASYYGKVWFAI